MTVCVSNWRIDRRCNGDGVICKKCDFKEKLADCERWVSELDVGDETRDRKKLKLETISLLFEELVEIVNERGFKVGSKT